MSFYDAFSGQTYAEPHFTPEAQEHARAHAAERDAILRRAGVPVTRDATLADLCDEAADALQRAIWRLPESDATDAAADAADWLRARESAGDAEIDAAFHDAGAVIASVADDDVADALNGWREAEMLRRHARDGQIDLAVVPFASFALRQAFTRPVSPVQQPPPPQNTLRPPAPVPAEPITVFDPSTLEGQPIRRREWIVPDWLPVGAVTICYADGGVGKTLLAQQLMTACAAGGLWCGMDVMRCRSVGFFCEDDLAELHWRQSRINATTGAGFADLAATRWISGVGEDNLLMTFEREGAGIITHRFDEIRSLAVSFGARLVVLDTAADTFGGNENVRMQVRQFVGRTLTKLAKDIDGAVLLNAHPSRTGLAPGGDQDGGSTAWNNSARSRWAITRPAEPGETPDPNARLLTRRKANYAATGAAISLRWDDGVLLPALGGGNGHSTPLPAASPEETFLALLGRLNASGVRVSHSKNAGNYGPKLMMKRTDRAGVSLRGFEAAMHALLTAGRIRVDSYGKPANGRTCLVVTTPDGIPDDAEPSPDPA